FAAHTRDDSAQSGCAAAVRAASTSIVSTRKRRLRCPSFTQPRKAGLPGWISEAGTMSKQVANKDRSACRPRFVSAVGTEFGEHRWLHIIGNILGYGIVQGNPALVDKHHRGQR